MDIWQIKVAKDLTEYFKSISNVKKIEFGGSLLCESTIDAFSDIDMDIILKYNDIIDMKEMIEVLSRRFANVLGYEIYDYENRDMLRICFDNGWRFDMTFLYPDKKEGYKADNTIEEKIDRTIHQFWFISFMVLVKLGRNDYLIASHLTLELCQLTIVTQMLIRDKIKSTNIHRFGEKEDIPILHSLFDMKIDKSLSENNNVNEILCILFQATEQMDNMSSQINQRCNKKSNILKDLASIFNIC